MRHRGVIVAMMAALMLADPPAAAAGDPPEPVVEWVKSERPNIVLLARVEGPLPSDSVDARAFMAGLREAFEPEFYLTEGVTGGSPRLSMALANRFRLVHGDAFGDEWQVRCGIVEWVPPGREAPAAGRPDPARGKGGDSTRAGRSGAEAGPPDSLWGLRVTVAVLSPEAVQSGARPESVREEILLDVPFESRPAWFTRAGRSLGLLAVETLHRESRDLEPDTRVRMDGSIRKATGARDRPARAR